MFVSFRGLLRFIIRRRSMVLASGFLVRVGSHWIKFCRNIGLGFLKFNQFGDEPNFERGEPKKERTKESEIANREMRASEQARGCCRFRVWVNIIMTLVWSLGMQYADFPIWAGGGLPQVSNQAE